jgi:hypothetical protein
VIVRRIPPIRSRPAPRCSGRVFCFSVADHRHRGTGCAPGTRTDLPIASRRTRRLSLSQLNSRAHPLPWREAFEVPNDPALEQDRRLKAGPASASAGMGYAAWQMAMPRNVMQPGPWPEAAGPPSWARFAVRATGSLAGCRGDRFEPCLTPQPEPSPQHHPRRSAARTLPPGRPVAGIPSWRSTSLIASRVLAPTLPSGSPTS